MRASKEMAEEGATRQVVGDEAAREGVKLSFSMRKELRSIMSPLSRGGT